jgi:hypothetical protein
MKGSSRFYVAIEREFFTHLFKGYLKRLTTDDGASTSRLNRIETWGVRHGQRASARILEAVGGL